MSFDSITKVLSGEMVPAFYHPNLTLGMFLMHYLQRDPFRVIQTNHDDDMKITAGEMLKFGRKIASNLSSQFQVGDVVGFVGKNTNFAAPLVLGCFLAGTPFGPVDPTYSFKEIAHIFNLTKPKIVFCDHNFVDETRKALEKCDNDCEIVTIDKKTEGYRFVADLMEGQSDDLKNPDFGTLSSDDICAAILCSSGTTGLQKAVKLSHSYLMDATKAGGVMQSLGNNINRVITTQKYSPKLLIEIIEKHQVHAFVTPPNQITLLLESDVIEKANLSSVWTVIIAGGRLNPNYRQSMQKYLTRGCITMTYATTEIGIISTTTSFEGLSNSSGKIKGNMKLKVVDENGKSLGANETGEIHVAPRFKFLGYAGNQKESDEACDSEGWLNTGDLGYFNREGEIFVVDRKKEVYDYMNYQIFPSELESHIMQMEGVKAVCVIGIRDEAAVSLGAAVVVKKEGSSITEQDIVDDIANNFVDFKRLHGGVYFVEKMPMTSTGKIKRLQAREIAEKMSKERKQQY